MTTRDLIDAIATGEAEAVEASFNDIMAQKVSDKLDSMRTDMAQTMFKAPGEPEDEFDAETEIDSELETETTEENE